MSDQVANDDDDEQKVEIFPFQADACQLLDLMVNAFYSRKDIFLRELLANASDALDRARYVGCVGSTAKETDPELYIKIIPNEAAGTLTIIDTGIGMTKAELIKNLGTIAYSGTKAFMATLNDDAGMAVIGSLGVGFYSAYLVADRVQVVSKSDNDDQYVWESSAGGSFTIRPCNEESLVRGTKVVLHIKEEESEFLVPHVVKEAVCKYSKFVHYPIKLYPGDELIWTVINYEEWKTSDPVPDSVTLNIPQPLWMRDPASISREEYANFYIWMSRDFDEHLAVKHFSVKGEVTFRALLFVPRHPFLDYFAKNGRPHNIRLYAKRVFVTDKCEDLVPDYLNFIFGIVDSEDLTLNANHGALHQRNIIQAIRKHLVTKCIELMEEMAEDSSVYNIFYSNFVRNVKLAVYEDRAKRHRCANLLRYFSSKSGGEMISLSNYVCRMKEGQQNIYCVIGESMENVVHSVFIEALKERDLEVLYMADAMDEYVVNELGEYSGKRLVSVSRLDLEIPQDKTEKEDFEKKVADFDSTCRKMKEILGDKVEEVLVSSRLTTSPCCIVTSNVGWSANMQRIVSAQALRNPHSISNNCAKKYLEINPNNAIITNLKMMLSNDRKPDKIPRDILTILYNAALLDSGFPLTKPRDHTNWVHSLIKTYFSVPECVPEKDEEERVDAESEVALTVQAGGEGTLDEFD